MTELLERSRPAQGLRERKKAKTRAAIQRHALRLFREQGYVATTVEQIAAAAEVSPSTFFRYFPTKEDVVLYDPFDPVLIAALEAQPPLLSPMQAIREALRATFAAMSGEDMEEQWERGILILSIPDVRMRMLNDFLVTAQLLAELVASRMGRHPDDLAVRTFVGGVIGALMAAFLAGMSDPNADFVALMDESLRLLEAGLPL
jgi:AcrR family transcriptional regulator